MKPIRKIFASNLKRLRKQKGLTQEELAEKMRINVRYLQRLEGKSCPSVGLDTIASFARALQAKPREFLEG